MIHLLNIFYNLTIFFFAFWTYNFLDMHVTFELNFDPDLWTQD